MKKLYFLTLLAFLATVLNAQDFYDLRTIQTIEITFEEDNWDELLDAEKAGDDGYIMAQSVSINGEVFNTVGVKYKGNSTYSASQTKNPFHIELDTYIDQEYDGYTDIKLSNAAYDPSFLREVLSYQVVRKYMDAPLSNYANVYVNGTLIGLYSNSEAISKKFVNNYFGSKTNTFVKCNPPDGADQSTTDLPNLKYLGQDSADYYSAYELKSDNGWGELIDLCDTLTYNIADIEEILDVDRALWMLAFDNALVNLDSYIGAFSQNYYLYRDDSGRFLPVVWDLNESFGRFSQTGSSTTLNSTSDKQQMSHLLHASDSDFPLIKMLLSIPMYKRMYLAHYKTMLLENFDNDSYYDSALVMQTIIDASVQADKNKFFTYDNFIDNLTADITSGMGPGSSSTPGITKLMDGRSAYLLALSDFTNEAPTIADMAVSNESPEIGAYDTISVSISDASAVYLGYRTDSKIPYTRVQLFDNGLAGDVLANDGIYSAAVLVNNFSVQYYIYAENDDAGIFSPARAQHEYYSITAVAKTVESTDVVLNELMASNETTQADQDGEYDDWIELYNNTDAEISLSGYYLSDDEDDLTQWAFPDTSIAAGSYLIVWADDDEDQIGLHANFKLSTDGESVYLLNSEYTIVNYTTFGAQIDDMGFARVPNGTGDFVIQDPTFSVNNDIRFDISSDLALNELMASNKATQADQDGEYDDWIELYNNTDAEISLLGYYLSDDEEDLTLWAFPDTSIAAGSFLIVWADKDDAQVGLHASLKLSTDGETVYLVNSDTTVVNYCAFGEQTDDMGDARVPDGTGDFVIQDPTFSATNGESVVDEDEDEDEDVEITYDLSTDVVLNELMASNETTQADQDGEYDDWIELYNNTDSEISLLGYYLSDDEEDMTQWSFPDTSIAAGSYLIVWADDDDQVGLHTNFKLSAGGESVYLVNSEYEVINYCTFGEQTDDMGYARVPNGTGNFVIQDATFSASNDAENTNSIYESLSDSYSVYPNPASDILYVHMGDQVYTNNTITITDLMGQTVYYNIITNQSIMEIDISSMTSGIYILFIDNENGFFNKKFIKK
jgi:hypothetical protein